MTRAVVNRAFAILGVALAAALTGCSGPGRYDVQIAIAPSWQAEGVNKSVTVDLIGVNPTDHDRWANQPMQGYADSQLRKDSVASIRSYRFSPSDTETKTLDSDDEIWDRWHARGATELFVLADIPGVRDEGSPTGSGATRLILPLDTSCWKIGTIRLLLRPGSIVAETPPDPDCAK